MDMEDYERGLQDICDQIRTLTAESGQITIQTVEDVILHLHRTYPGTSIDSWAQRMKDERSGKCHPVYSVAPPKIRYVYTGPSDRVTSCPRSKENNGGREHPDSICNHCPGNIDEECPFVVKDMTKSEARPRMKFASLFHVFEEDENVDRT
jgi:hypothetical protein